MRPQIHPLVKNAKDVNPPLIFNKENHVTFFGAAKDTLLQVRSGTPKFPVSGEPDKSKQYRIYRQIGLFDTPVVSRTFPNRHQVFAGF